MPNNSFSLIFLFLMGCFFCNGQGLSYYGDIKPIIDQHCVRCHQSGEVGAMPLITYEDVTAYGKMIEYVTSSKLMPPWYADVSYSHFSNERFLAADEIQKIKDWVSNDMPEGVKEKTKVSLLDSSSVDRHRDPDLVLSMAESFEQYGIYLDQYQVFVLPTHLKEDTWVEGIEFVPGNKKIVRFASVSLEDSDKFDSLDRWDPRYGYYSFGGLGKTPDSPFWYTWSPQQKPVFFENHSAIFLPKDSKLLLHIHYGPTGRPEKDSSVIRLYFSTQKPSNHIQTAPLINPYAITNDSLFLPPDTKKIFHASYTLPYDIQLMSLTPQANLYCRSWEVYAMRPNEHFPIKLLKINDWNFNWKQSFFLESPITLPKGTVIHALAHYDNSFDNPCNPSDKPIPVSWGAHLFSELFFIHFQYSTILDSTSAIELLAPVVVSGPALNISMVIRKSDFYSIRICDPNGYNEKIVYTADLKKGSQKIITDIGLVKDGNYVLRVVDKNAVVVAEQLFTKMRENGM